MLCVVRLVALETALSFARGRALRSLQLLPSSRLIAAHHPYASHAHIYLSRAGKMGRGGFGGPHDVVDESRAPRETHPARAFDQNRRPIRASRRYPRRRRRRARIVRGPLARRRIENSSRSRPPESGAAAGPRTDRGAARVPRRYSEERVAAPPRVPRGYSEERIAAPPRVPRRYSEDGSRHRRGCLVDIPRPDRGAAAGAS